MQRWSQVTFLDDPCCGSCGFPFDYSSFETGEVTCAGCVAYPPAYDHARSAIAYDDYSRDMILSFKHGGRTEAVQMFALQMKRAGHDLLRSADRLMPVPLYKRRLVRRRYNQAALLTRALTKYTGIKANYEDLYRKRATDSQGGKSASGRRRNVQGAFALRKNINIKGQHIVLIDDVMTTGATLNACARVLKRGGAARVDALTLSRVVKGASVPT